MRSFCSERESHEFVFEYLVGIDMSTCVCVCVVLRETLHQFTPYLINVIMLYMRCVCNILTRKVLLLFIFIFFCFQFFFSLI